MSTIYWVLILKISAPKPFKKTDKVGFVKRFVGFFYNQADNVKPNYQYTICQNIHLPDKISRYNRIFIKKNLSL